MNFFKEVYIDFKAVSSDSFKGVSTDSFKRASTDPFKGVYTDSFKTVSKHSFKAVFQKSLHRLLQRRLAVYFFTGISLRPCVGVSIVSTVSKDLFKGASVKEISIDSLKKTL